MFEIFKKNNFMEWKDYKNKIEFIEDFNWRQRVRRQNIQNV